MKLEQRLKVKRETKKSDPSMDLMMDAATLFSSLNVVVLVGLMYMYSRIVMRTRASYPAGLMIFASLLLVQNLLTAYSYIAMTSFFDAAVLPYLAAISILQFGGLVTLTRITA